MVQIDVPIAFGIGSLLADAAYKQIRAGRAEYYYRALAKNNIYQTLFFSWIPVYFLLNNFGWETSHMWWHADSVTAYPYYIPIFMVIFFLAANGGFWLGGRLIQNDRCRTNRAVYLGILIYSGIWIFSQPGRTFRLGTYADWVADDSPWFWNHEKLWEAVHAPFAWEDTTFLFMLAFTLVVWAVPLFIFYRQLRKEGMHLDPRDAEAMKKLSEMSLRDG